MSAGGNYEIIHDGKIRVANGKKGNVQPATPYERLLADVSAEANGAS
ncbi:MAG: hypothetical protein LBF60_09080 [Treponema sp.]|nr:hypothetical protein [Treponema sp.]